MHYLIWVDDDMLHGDVADRQQEFLRDVVTPALQPLTGEDYKNGPAAILQTMARYSYVLDGGAVWWCVEWDPALLVVRFSADGTMQWAAVEGPSPTVDDDEGHDDPRHKLVFDAWDAQFDEQPREWGGFSPAPPELEDRWEAAMAHVNQLADELIDELGDDEEAFEAWRQRCVASEFWGDS